MEPNAKGVYKISEEIRRQWHAGGDEKKNVVKLYAEANFDTDCHVLACTHAYHEPLSRTLTNAFQETFVRRHSTTAENSKEMELAVDFEYLSKGEMADEPYRMCERLLSNPDNPRPHVYKSKT